MSLNLDLSADASRPSNAGVLTPSSEASVNRLSKYVSSSSSTLRKRKSCPLSAGDTVQSPEKRTRQSILEDMLHASISITPYPPNVLAKPTLLQPLMVLPREHLELSLLDRGNPYGEFDASRFVESHIKILDLEHRMGKRPAALIAISKVSQNIYAVEHHKNHLYVICKLGPWVDLEDLSILASVSCSQIIQKLGSSSKSVAKPAAVPFTTPQLHHEQKLRRQAIEELQLGLKRQPRPRSQSVCKMEQLTPESKETISTSGNDERPSSRQNQPEENQAALPQATRCSTPVRPSAEDEGHMPPTATEIFEALWAQYHEMLYHSKGSLAYFAKGPLSRARSAFQIDLDGNLNVDDLIEFVKSLLLKIQKLDDKYRKWIPQIVTGMKTRVESSGDEQKSANKSRGRKPNKLKLGKNCLYPSEDEHVRKWWRAILSFRRTHLPEEERVSDQETASYIQNLKARETQLQMILILEVLALQREKETRTIPSHLPGFASEEVKDSPAKTSRRTRGLDLHVLLEMHADRLNIWQEVTAKNLDLAGDPRLGGIGQETRRPDQTGSDPLKDFCIDIAKPFFAGRVAEQTDLLCRKFGAPPIISSPPKPKSLPMTKPTRPGAPAKRSGLARRAPSLERALSEEIRSRRSMSRGPSALDNLRRAVMPVLRRESSDGSSLSKSLPKVEPGSLKQSPSNSQVRRRSGKLFEDAMPSKQDIDDELRDAISALRKPNRTLVGKSIADDADNRRSSLSRMRKGKKPTRMLPGSTPQKIIKATPANFRFKDALAGASSDHHVRHTSLNSFQAKLKLPGIHIMGEDETIPSSSDIVSVSAPNFREPSVRSSVFPSSAEKIAGTPLKTCNGTPNGLLNIFNEDSVLPSSPLTMRKVPPKAIAAPSSETVSVSTERGVAVPNTPQKRLVGAIFDTPAKLGRIRLVL